MKKILTILLMAFFAIGLFAQQKADITPLLADKMQTAPNTRHSILIFLTDHVDVLALEQFAKQKEYITSQHTTYLINALQAKATATQPDFLQSLTRIKGIDKRNIRQYWVTNLICLEADASMIDQIAQLPQVEYIDYNAPIELHHDVKVASNAMVEPGAAEPGLIAIGAPFMWNLGYTGYGRIAMIIDTGEDPDHPAIGNHFRGNTHTLAESWSGDGTPGYCIGESISETSHGTHVTGTIMGIDRAMDDTIGVAFDAQWIAGGVELLGCDGFMNGTVESIIYNFEWALDPDNNPNTTDDIPDVINNSWGTPFPGTFGCNGSFQMPSALINTLYAVGIAPVFSAGNEGPQPSSIGSPAHIALDTVRTFSIGATQPNPPYSVGVFSSRGPTTCNVEQGPLKIKPEVSAPGVGIRSAIVGGGYQSWNGTSMAAPHVSGAIVLLREAFPYLTGETIMLALYNTATDLGEVGEDNIYGRGLINLEAAYNYLLAKGHTPVPPTPRNLDLVILDIYTSDLYCDNRYYPEILIENAGTDTVYSFDVEINFTRTGNTEFRQFAWNGKIAPGEEKVIYYVDGFTLPSGQWKSTYNLALPNGSADNRPLNNTIYENITISSLEALDYEALTNPICAGEQAILTYNGDLVDDANVWWYESQADENTAHKGLIYQTPPLEENQLFYGTEVYQVTTGRDTSNADLTDGVFDKRGGLQFNAFRPFRIRTAMVYAEAAGNAGILLTNTDGGNIGIENVTLEPGWNQVELNFDVPVGNNWVLTQQYGVNTFVEDVTPFPINIPSVMSIVNSVFTDDAFDYAKFYNWEIEYVSACGRKPIEVEVVGGTNDTVAIHAELLTDGRVSFEAEGSDIAMYMWHFHNGDVASGPSVEYTYPKNGVYEVFLSAQTDAGCYLSRRITVMVDNAVATRTPVRKTPLTLNAYPNPTSGHLQLVVTTEKADDLDLQFVNILGQVPISSQRSVIAGDNVINLSLHGLEPGIYILYAETSDKRSAIRIVIQ